MGTPPLTPLRQNWIVVLAFGGSDLEKNGEKRNSVDSPAKTAPTPVALYPFPVFPPVFPGLGGSIFHVLKDKGE